MSKRLLLVIALVICSHTILLTNCGNDDEFAEFDTEFASSDAGVLEDKPILSKEKPSSDLPSKEKVDDTGRSENAKLDTKKVKNEPASVITDKLDSNEEQVSDQTQKKPDLKLVNAPLPRIYNWESYYIEIAFLLASLLYFINFFAGSSKNQKFAQEWYEQMREFLKQQFALVGGSPQVDGQKKDEDGDVNPTGVKKQRGLIKATESMYTLWMSGRVGLDGLLVEINLLKRQDLFSMALNLLKPSKDSLVLRFLLNQDGYENFVFCLAHKNQASKLARDLVDINTFCPKKKPISQHGVELDRLFIMSELSDVTSFILDQRMVSFIKKYEESINFIHITDQYSTVRSDEMVAAQKLANPKRMATFSFAFPQSATDRVEYVLFSLSLLDRLRRFKLARDSKQKSEKNRQKITDILQKTAFSQRQEAAQSKKEELRRLEKERIYNEDDPEKQRLWEKKEARRELKKNKMRVKQLKVKSM